MRWIVAVLLIATPAWGQGLSTSPNPVRARVTGEVSVPNRVDVNVDNEFVPVLGPEGARIEVDIPGTVSLSAGSLASIAASTAERVCTYAVGDPDSLSLTTTAENVPASPLANRTAISISNQEVTRAIWCNPAGTATATAAWPIPAGTTQKFEGLNGATISCRCSTGTCAYAYLEERCSQPSP